MRRAVVLLVVSHFAISPAALWSQDLADPLAELRQRLDALERENRELRGLVTRQLSNPAPTSSYQIAPPAEFAIGANEDRIRTIVEEYLSARGVQAANFESASATVQPSGNPPGIVVGDDLNMVGKWTPNGAELQTRSGDFKTKLSGRVQADYAAIASPDPTQITSIPGGAGTKDSFFFRRIRLGGYGTFWELIDWAAEFDFANTEFNIDPAAGGNNPPTGLRSSSAFPAGGNVINVATLTDVWMTFRELPYVGNIRVGNQKEMIGLEH